MLLSRIRLLASGLLWLIGGYFSLIGCLFLIDGWSRGYWQWTSPLRTEFMDPVAKTVCAFLGLVPLFAFRRQRWSRVLFLLYCVCFGAIAYNLIAPLHYNAPGKDPPAEYGSYEQWAVGKPNWAEVSLGSGADTQLHYRAGGFSRDTCFFLGVLSLPLWSYLLSLSAPPNALRASPVSLSLRS